MKVRCTTCGKSSSVPDSDAGLLGLCPACGASFRVPNPSPAEPTSVAQAVAAVSEASPVVRSIWGVVALWVGISLIACATGAGVWWGVHSRDRVRAGQALVRAESLRAKAELSLSTNNIKRAEAEYAELETFVVTSGRPDLEKISDQVRRELTATRGLPASDGRPLLKSPSTAPSVVSSTTGDRSKAKATLAAQSAGVGLPSAHANLASVHQVAPAADLPPVDDKPHLAQTMPAHAADAPPPVSNGRPRVQPVAEASDVLTDEKIGAAITRGIDQLLSDFDPRTHLIRGAEDQNSVSVGLDILCVYALMQAQQATNDPRLNPHDALMIGMIEAMKRLQLGSYHWETYARGLRSTALALYNRPEDRDVLKEDATALENGSHSGGYTYVLARGKGFRDDAADRGDNSNSQYGLLGVWSAAEVGFEVSDVYWNLIQHHWTSSQLSSGEWSYNRGQEKGTHSMTCAGLASMFVTHDYLDVPKFGTEVGRDPFTPSLWKGLNWLERGNNAVTLSHGAYDLYGLERVGLASGFKFFGTHEWYRELATEVISKGGFGRRKGGAAVETAYTLLFLARGRHPILMNKVRFDGFWANRPRDVANLARFAGYQLERPLNWQVVPIARDWTDWMDSPILYISSHKAIKLSETEYGKIRSYVENGGLLFMQADGGAVEFNRFAHEAAHTLFPAYELTLLPATHPLRNVMFKTKPTGNLYMVSNGSRILMLYSSQDLSKSWQLRDNKNKPFPFEIGTNLFIYAAGKRELRNHLTSTYIPAVKAAPSATYSIARLKYPGNWDPEPAAWQRFSRWFHLNTGYALTITELPINELKPETAPVAHLTGTASYDLTDSESAAIKNYVQSGGVLLVDLCGGAGAFDKSVQSSLFFKVFANSPSHVMSPSHPLLAGGTGRNGMDDLSKPILRQYATDKFGKNAGLPEEIAVGKGHVIFTSLDLTSALLGTNTWGILGYEPAYAQSLVKNTILWTLDGQHEETPVANR